MIIGVITIIVNPGQMLYHSKLGKFSLTDLDVIVTKLVILSPSEKKRFDSPPKFNADEQTIYFALNNDILHILDKLRTVTNKVGFLLQLAYFRSHGKFYTANQFRQRDIDYVIRLLGLNANQLDFDKYQKRIPALHRKKILARLGWRALDQTAQTEIFEHLLWHVKNQHSPKQLFLIVIDYCWQHKIELPSYNQIALWITQAYNENESTIVTQLKALINRKHEKLLTELVSVDNDNKRKFQRAPITQLKQINQSLRPSDIQENVKTFILIKTYFDEFQLIYKELDLSDQATEYFAIWVQKAENFQINSFSNKYKLYLHLLAYIKHQYFTRQDVLIDIFLKSVQSTLNTAKKQLLIQEKENRSSRNKAIKQLTKSNKDTRLLIEDITYVVKSSVLSEQDKLIKIEALIDQYHEQHTYDDKQQIIAIENTLNNVVKQQDLFDALESLSMRLQRRVSSIIKQVEFNQETSDAALVEAIVYFKSMDGNIQPDAPTLFLDQNKQEVLFSDGKMRVSLYKVFLFIHMADAIKSGKLNLKYSYRYKAIHEYLIDKIIWEHNKERLLRDAGLSEYADLNTVLNELKQTLNAKYGSINKRYLSGENPYLTIENQSPKINTPKVDNDNMEYISTLLTEAGYVPILQVLSDVNQASQFVSCFKHHSNKHKKMKPYAQTIFAGILGKGCNIGIGRMANISVGITEDILKNTVNWCFNLKNLQSANNKILQLINKLALANCFKQDQSRLHTGSDGRKANVAVDSLHANYSFKYFGKGKGVTMYTFLDERHMLFYSTVISASDREAAYVIDGLLQNEVIKSDIHSTDTHGFTETIFAATHLIGTSFAPRFKKIANQNIYAFKSRESYERSGCQILPSRSINQRIIREHWDDLLRFMATIKLKHTSASQLFKRLSSYAKDHPLYKALKEFGRIIKSIFILTYYDELELRQRIEKQLNKVELSNKFAKAIFFANNREFQQGDPENQKIATACMVLIQNAIVLWNYLYLSQLLAENTNTNQRQQMIESIKHGSMITWQHVNLQGEYDFTKHAANDMPFDLTKILALQVG